MSEPGIKKPSRAAATCMNKGRKRRLITTVRAAADPSSRTNASGLASGSKTTTARRPSVKTSSERPSKARAKGADKACGEVLSKSHSSPGHLAKTARLSGRTPRRRAQLPSIAASKQHCDREHGNGEAAAVSSEEESSSESEDTTEDEKKTTTKKKPEAAHAQKKPPRRCAFDTLFTISAKGKVRRVFPKLPSRSDRLLEANALPSNTNYHLWFRDGSGDILPCVPQVSSDKACPEPWRTCPLILGDVTDYNATSEKLLTCAQSKLKMKKKAGSDAPVSKRTPSTSWPLFNLRPTVYETNSQRLLQEFAASSDELLFASAGFPLGLSQCYCNYDLLFPSQILAYRSQHKSTNQNNDNNAPKRRDKTTTETFTVDPRFIKTPLAIQMLNSICSSDSGKHINRFIFKNALKSFSAPSFPQATSQNPCTEGTNLSNENASTERSDLGIRVELSSLQSQQLTSTTKKWSIIQEPVPGENNFRLKLTSPEEQRDEIMRKLKVDTSSKAAALTTINRDLSETENPRNKTDELHPSPGPELGAKIGGTTELKSAGSSTDVKVKSTTSCTKLENFEKIQIPVTNWRYAEKLFRRFPVRKVNSVVRKSLSEVLRDLREEKGCLINNCKTCGSKGKAFVKKNKVEAPANAKNQSSITQSPHSPNKLTPQQALASTVKASSTQQPTLPMSCGSLLNSDSEDFEIDSLLACTYSNVPDSNVNFNVSSYNTQNGASNNLREKTETSNYCHYKCRCKICTINSFMSNIKSLHDIRGYKSSYANQHPKLKMVALEKAAKSHSVDWHTNHAAEIEGWGFNESTSVFDSNPLSKLINNRPSEKAFNALVESVSNKCMLLDSIEKYNDTTFLLNSRSPLLFDQQMLRNDIHTEHNKTLQNCILMENTLNERKDQEKYLVDCSCCIFTAIESLIYKSEKYHISPSISLLKDKNKQIPLYNNCKHRFSLKRGAEDEGMECKSKNLFRLNCYCSHTTGKSDLRVGGLLTNYLPMCQLKSRPMKPKDELVKEKCTKLIDSDTEASLAKSSKLGVKNKLVRSKTFCDASPSFFDLTMVDPSEQRFNVHEDSSKQDEISEEISDKHNLHNKATSNFKNTHRCRGYRLIRSSAHTDCSRSIAAEGPKKIKVEALTLNDTQRLLAPSHEIYRSEDESFLLPSMFAHKTEETGFKIHQNEVAIKTNKINLEATNRDDVSCLQSQCVKFDNMESTNTGNSYQLTVSDSIHLITAVLSRSSPLLEPHKRVNEEPVLNVSNDSSSSTVQTCKAKQERSSNWGCSISEIAVHSSHSILEYIESRRSSNTDSESAKYLCSQNIKSTAHRHNVEKSEESHRTDAYNQGVPTLKGDISTQSDLRKILSSTSNEHCHASLWKQLYLNSNSGAATDSVLIENVEKDNTDKMFSNSFEYDPDGVDKLLYTSRNKRDVLPTNIPVAPPNSPEPVKCKPVVKVQRKKYQRRLGQLSRPRLSPKRFTASSDAVVQKNETAFVPLPLKKLNLHKNHPSSAVSFLPSQTWGSAADDIMGRSTVSLQNNRRQDLDTLCCMGFSVGNPIDTRKLECKRFSSYTREPIVQYKEQKIPVPVTHAQHSDTLLRSEVDVQIKKPHLPRSSHKTFGTATFLAKHGDNNIATIPKPCSTLDKNFANNIRIDQMYGSMDSALDSMTHSIYDPACFTDHQSKRKKGSRRYRKKSAFFTFKIAGIENAQNDYQSPHDKESRGNKPVIRLSREPSSITQNKVNSLDNLCESANRKCQDSQESPGLSSKRHMSVLCNVTEQTSNNSCKDLGKHVKSVSPTHFCYLLNTSTFRQKDHKDNTNCEMLNISNKPKPKEQKIVVFGSSAKWLGASFGRKVISSLPVARPFRPVPNIFWASAHTHMQNPSKTQIKPCPANSERQPDRPKLIFSSLQALN